MHQQSSRSKTCRSKPKNKRKLIHQIAPNQSKKTKTKPNQNQKTKTKKNRLLTHQRPPKQKKKEKKGRWTHLVLFGFGLGVSDDESIFFALFGFRFFGFGLAVSDESVCFIFLFWFGCFVYIVSKYLPNIIYISSQYHLLIIFIPTTFHPTIMEKEDGSIIPISSTYYFNIIRIHTHIVQRLD